MEYYQKSKRIIKQMNEQKTEPFIVNEGLASLFSWTKKNITEVATNCNVNTFSLTILTEEGINSNFDVFRDNLSEEDYNASCIRKVETINQMIKEAHYHERVIIKVSFQYLNGYLDEHTFVVARFEDETYVLKNIGTRVKYKIFVSEVNPKYSALYFLHFTLSGFINTISKDHTLPSIITNNKLEITRFKTLSERLGEDSPTITLLKETLVKIKEFLEYLIALSDEELNALSHLKSIGKSNYVIYPDKRIKIYIISGEGINKIIDTFFLSSIKDFISSDII